MSAILKVENLRKEYGRITAVDGISFAVEEGEIVGLLGPNGAGKTTTIHMILSLLEPTKGKIEIFGKNLREYRDEILAKMNFAAPYAQLPYNLTPYENLAVFALLYGVKNYKERAETLLKEFRLEQFRKSRTGALSSGEQTRVGLAKAFLNDPKLLLLDEPTVSLDPAIARELRGDIYERIKKNGGAILWTSHNMKEVETMCDRVIFLAHGRIVADNTPQNLREQFGKDDLEDVFVELAREPEKPLGKNRSESASSAANAP